MTAVALPGSGASASNIGPSVLRYSSLGCGPQDWNATESARQVPWHHDSTLSGFALHVTTNAIAADSAAAIRINGATGTQIILIPAGLTGVFRDITNSDPVVAGDLVNALVLTGAGGALLQVQNTMIVSDAATKTSAVYFSQNTGAMNVAGSTYFLAPVGQSTSTTTEANATVRASTNGTYKHSRFVVSANTRADATTIRCRINGGFGTISINVPAGTTGTFEDLLGSDAILDGDDWCHAVTLGAGAGSISIQRTSVEFETEDGSAQLYAFNSTAVIVNAGATKYYPFGGNGINVTAETTAQMLAGLDNTYHRLQCRITANTLTSDSALTARNNGAAGTQIIVLPTGLTGIFEDVTNEDVYLAADLTSIALTAGATGTSIRMTWVSIVQKAVPQPVADTPTGGHFIPEVGPTFSEREYRRLQRRLAGLREEVEQVSLSKTESEEIDEVLEDLAEAGEEIRRLRPKADAVSKEVQNLLSSALYRESPDLITPLVKDLETILAAISAKEAALEMEEDDVLTIILLFH